MQRRRLNIVLLTFCLISNIANPGLAEEATEDLLNMSLEDLLDIKIVTASKKEQKIEDSPSTLYVVTAEDIRAYGAHNVGEALRMVPGIEIFQMADHNYEVAIRSLSRTAYNTSMRVLWLLNGRSIYNDAFGGVRMESFNVPIDTIERIEIVRGPGSALYGANAFSGIINIITRANENSSPVFLKGAYGSLEQVNSHVHLSGNVNSRLSYGFNAGFDNLNQDAKRLADLGRTTRDSLLNLGYTVGEIYGARAGSINTTWQYAFNAQKSATLRLGYADNVADRFYLFAAEVHYRDYFAQIDLTDSANQLRVYLNANEYGNYKMNAFMSLTTPTHPYLQARERLQSYTQKTFLDNELLDVEYSRFQQVSSRLSAVAGASYRHNWVKSSLFDLSGTGVSKNIDLMAGYVQADYKPFEHLTLIFGGRYDWNSTVGSHFNPRFAAVFKPASGHAIRFNVGTATRNPNFFDNFMEFDVKLLNLRRVSGLDPIYNLGMSGDHIIYHGTGSEDVKSERLTTAELGYQWHAANNLQFTADLFFTRFSDMLRYSPAYIEERIETLENVPAIFTASGVDVSAIFRPDEKDFNQAQMTQKVTQLEQTIAFLQQNGQATQAAQLQLVVNALKKMSGLYGLQKVVGTSIENVDESYDIYGGEFALSFFPTRHLTLTANYAHLTLDDGLNSEQLINGELKGIMRSPQHKFNIGVKYKIGGLYTGVMFNYMSYIKHVADNNRNGVLDSDDFHPRFENGGYYRTDPVTRLTVNIGYQWLTADRQTFDVFLTGYNLIQDDFQQTYRGPTTTGGDKLNRRIVGGIRISY